MRPAVAALATLALALTGCGGSDDPAGASPGDEPSRLVLSPPSAGAEHTHAPGETDAAVVGDGTSASAGDYTIADIRLPDGTDGPGPMSFRILDADDRPVTAYEEVQTQRMHLYVVRDDLSIYRHLHPTLEGGTWSAPVDLDAPGDYRVIADFQPTGATAPVVLAGEASVPGRWRPATVPADGQGDDGVVRVRVDGTGEVGDNGRLRFVVSRVDGTSLTLGSYLGATAHVSGFRVAEDPAGQVFVHVHPYGAPEETDEGSVLTFHTVFEQPGDYRFFVQVRVDGVVHTAAVTAAVRP